jgi:hypothetical protein
METHGFRISAGLLLAGMLVAMFDSRRRILFEQILISKQTNPSADQSSADFASGTARFSLIAD